MGRSWWRRRDRLALNKLGTAGASNPPPPESDPAVEHALPSPHPPPESDTVAEHALLSPPPPPPESDTVVVFAPPSPPPPPPLESDTVVEHLLPSPPPSPPSVVINHPPACVNQSRFKPPSLLDCAEDVPSASDSPDGHGADNSDGHNRGEGAVARQYRHGADNNDEHISAQGAVVREDSSDGDVDNAEDEVGYIGDPFLTDSFGNVTTWRLSDLSAEFTNYLEEEASKPKEKKLTKEERLKVHSNRMERYMKSALQKYNGEEKLPEDMYFEFDKVQSQNWIVEGDYDNQFYYHFNFSATQAFSTSCLFFAEVIPDDGDGCDITCCKILNGDDNGHCYGCKNAHVDDLRHPACSNDYVGGHIDQKFPFMTDSESEDDSD